MRILIVPYIRTPRSDASYFITQNIATLFTQNGHAVAISASKENNFHHAALYPYAAPRPLPSFLQKETRSYEEWMKQEGCLRADYLRKDLLSLKETVQHFHCDLIITLDRLAGILIARMMHIPCWAFVHADIYKKNHFPKSIMKDVNTVLSECHLEQEFDLKSLYRRCNLRFGISPIEVQPFPPQEHVIRIGIASLTPVHTLLTNRVCVFLPDVKKKPQFMRQTIIDAFDGAPYSVYAWYNGCHAEVFHNIHFLSAPKPDLLPGSICVIHDGNQYFVNQSLARGIIQVIVATHGYARGSALSSAERYHFGLGIFEEEFSMAKLYETYRLVLSDDMFYYHTQAMKDIITKDGDLSLLLDYIPEPVSAKRSV